MGQNEPKIINPEQLRSAFASLGKQFSITEGYWSRPKIGDTIDIDWNHMDQNHRKWIHNTYNRTVRIYTGDNLAVSLTNIPKRVIPIPFFTLVVDIRLKRGVFYQIQTFLSLIHFHVVQDWRKDKMETKWYVVSHWLLKPLHAILSKRYTKLLNQIDPEDVPLRVRRKELRKQGFTFENDGCGFRACSDLKSSVVPPKDFGRHHLSTAKIQEEPKEYSVGKLRFWIARKKSEEEFRVWPEVCPHDGGPVRIRSKNGEGMICPWHHIEFQPLKISPKNAEASLYRGKIRVKLTEGDLVFEGESARSVEVPNVSARKPSSTTQATQPTLH